jgi:hypothetical protein
VEITSALPTGDYRDHPDIVARVFWLKFQAMMKDIMELQIFGQVAAFVWRIEWQARGLPHAHLLVILVNAIQSIRQIDAIVSAEIPDPALLPELYCIVKEFQIHTPCDNVPESGCRDNEKKECKRHFPKDMSRETVWMGNMYPKYRRRGRFCCDVKGRQTSDDWVVPYSPFLSLMYRAHCNVEVASSIKSFKYVYKYVLKSPDSAVISINEIQAHLIQTNTQQQKRIVKNRKILFVHNKQSKTHSQHTTSRTSILAEQPGNSLSNNEMSTGTLGTHSVISTRMKQ